MTEPRPSQSPNRWVAWALPLSILAHAAVVASLVCWIRTRPPELSLRTDPAAAGLAVFLVEAPAPNDPLPAADAVTPAPNTDEHESIPAPQLSSQYIVTGESVVSVPAVVLSWFEGPDQEPPAKPPAPTSVDAPAAGSPESAAAPVPATGNPAPVYPESCRRAGEEGSVTLRFSVSPEGSVAAVRVESSSGIPLLDQSALDTAARWRFTPASSAGAAVESDVLIPIRFRLTRPVNSPHR